MNLCILLPLLGQNVKIPLPVIYVVIASDLNAPDLGESVLQNNYLIKSNTIKVAKEIDYSYELVEFYKDRFYSDSIVSFFQKLKIGSKDIIWFFYSGHGANSGKNKWPCFLMPGSNRICLEELCALIQTKINPRLLILHADCCNLGGSYFKSSKTKPTIVHPIDTIFIGSDVIKHLFLHFNGVLKLSGSQIGQSAEYMVSSGGIFTNCFFEQLAKFRNAEKVDPMMQNWTKLLEDVSKRTSQVAKAFNRVQQPLMQIDFHFKDPQKK